MVCFALYQMYKNTITGYNYFIKNLGQICLNKSNLQD
jgi:hypothetical protein